MLEQTFRPILADLQPVIFAFICIFFLNNAQNISSLHVHVVFLLVESQATIRCTAYVRSYHSFHRIFLFKLQNTTFQSQISLLSNFTHLLDLPSNPTVERRLKLIMNQPAFYATFELLYDIGHVKILGKYFVRKLQFRSAQVRRIGFLVFDNLVEEVDVHCLGLRFEPFAFQRAPSQLKQTTLIDYKFRLDKGCAWSCIHELLVLFNLLHLNGLSFRYYNSNQKPVQRKPKIVINFCSPGFSKTRQLSWLYFSFSKIDEVGRFDRKNLNLTQNQAVFALQEYNVIASCGQNVSRPRRQQNYMSVQVKEKQVNYNDSHFYRANPYINQGYIPTSSLKNRKQPDFITEIPQGIDYFDPSNKKHFTQITKKSIISEQNLLSNPERYPYQNRIANDFNYHRNLNTIDIEGANANSKKSKAMKNRIKAQQELKRRNAKIITPILWNGLSEEQIRRKLADEQLQRINSRQNESKGISRKYHSQSKLPSAETYTRNHQKQMKEEGIQSDILTLQKYLAFQQKQEDNQAFSSPENAKRDSNTPNGVNRRHQSQEKINKLLENKLKSDVKYEVQSNGSGHVAPPSSMSSNLNNQIRQYFEREKLSKEREQISQQYKQQFRQLNPTHLSYQGSIVKNSSIFSSLGKNIALG